MSSEDEVDKVDKKVKIPIANGDRKLYPVFKARFGHGELVSDVIEVTWEDEKADELITTSEHVRGKKTVEDYRTDYLGMQCKMNDLQMML